MPNPAFDDFNATNPFATEQHANDIGRRISAQMQAATLSGEKLVKEYRENIAQALISVGITLIPSDYLRDHEYVVSRGVYEAAKNLMKGT